MRTLINNEILFVSAGVTFLVSKVNTTLNTTLNTTTNINEALNTLIAFSSLGGVFVFLCTIASCVVGINLLLQACRKKNRIHPEIAFE